MLTDIGPGLILSLFASWLSFILSIVTDEEMENCIFGCCCCCWGSLEMVANKAVRIERNQDERVRVRQLYGKWAAAAWKCVSYPFRFIFLFWASRLIDQTTNENSKTENAILCLSCRFAVNFYNKHHRNRNPLCASVATGFVRNSQLFIAPWKVCCQTHLFRPAFAFFFSPSSAISSFQNEMKMTSTALPHTHTIRNAKKKKIKIASTNCLKINLQSGKSDRPAGRSPPRHTSEM